MLEASAVYNLALLAFIPTAIMGIYYDFRHREVPVGTAFPAILGATIMLGALAVINIELALIYSIFVVAFFIVGFIMYSRNMAGPEDVWSMMLYAATPGGASIILMGGGLSLVHVVWRRLRHEENNTYENYSYYPYPIVAYFGIAYFVYLIYLVLY